MYDTIIVSDSPDTTRIHLNRPLSLNAMNSTLLIEVREAVDSTTKPIVFTGEGRAFCAGGDILSIELKKVSGRYMLNLVGSLFYHLSKLPQERTIILDGIALGGGVSFAMACSHRVLTNKTLLGIPETAIGFVPDVGVSYYLNRIESNELGLYLALTGNSLNGVDGYYAGFSQLYVQEMTGFIKNKVFSHGVNAVLPFCTAPESIDCEMLKYLQMVKQCFNTEFTVEMICEKLGEANTEWTRKTLDRLNDLCPLTLKLAHECFKRGKHMDYYDVIEMEHNVSVKSIEMANSNFHIGVQHKLLEKKKNRPNWIPNTFSQVSPELVQSFFSNTSYKLIEYKL